jgi:hypothetical protein
VRCSRRNAGLIGYAPRGDLARFLLEGAAQTGLAPMGLAGGLQRRPSGIPSRLGALGGPLALLCWCWRLKQSPDATANPPSAPHGRPAGPLPVGQCRHRGAAIGSGKQGGRRDALNHRHAAPQPPGDLDHPDAATRNSRMVSCGWSAWRSVQRLPPPICRSRLGISLPHCCGRVPCNGGSMFSEPVQLQPGTVVTQRPVRRAAADAAISAAPTRPR